METKKTFDQVISESFDFEGLSTEEIIQAKKDLEKLLIENTLLRVFENDPDDTRYELFKKQLALYGETPESMMKFLNKELPEFYEIFFDEVDRAKNS